MITDNDKICPWHDYGQHIHLTCRNHPHLDWSTKNIAPIGARALFYQSGLTVGHVCYQGTPECACPISDLYHTCPDCEEYAKLEQLGSAQHSPAINQP